MSKTTAWYCFGLISALLLNACAQPASISALPPATNTAPTASEHTQAAIEKVIRKELESDTFSGSVNLGDTIKIEKLPTASWYKFETDYYEDYKPNHQIVHYWVKGICYMTSKTVKITTLELQNWLNRAGV